MMSFRPIEELISQLIELLFKIVFNNYLIFNRTGLKNYKFDL